MSRNRVIGAKGTIPWHLPEELKRFKQLTMGHHIIMGRKTWESIGRPLPGRTSVIVTRQADYSASGAIVTHSLDEAISKCGSDDEVFVIGGVSTSLWSTLTSRVTPTCLKSMRENGAKSHQSRIPSTTVMRFHTNA